MIEYTLLTGFYLLSVWLIAIYIYSDYQKQAFSFHLLFSLIYLVIFYLGFPFSMAIALGFDSPLAEPDILFITLFAMLAGYLIYWISYCFFAGTIRHQKPQAVKNRQNFAKLSANLTACFLLCVAIGSLVWFVSLNGWLLFELEKYSQIFSASIQNVWLKRFFYFFLPALLILFFLDQNKRVWWFFLILGIVLGGLNYIAVGGTRANLAMAVLLFFLLGLYKNYASFKALVVAGCVMIGAMFLLALARYGLKVNGSEALFTFLYLTRDTFSPWENLAKILSYPVEPQGLMPIVRDFYVYIPDGLWQAKPSYIVNTANYFTRELLGNFSGLAISPTLLGSFYIMGGLPMIVLGMALVGWIIQSFDRLFSYAKYHQNKSDSAIILAYCMANLFNFVVLVREGLDAFISRWVFFSIVFLLCWCVAKLITLSFEAGLSRTKVDKNDSNG
ncbi:ECA oligosaccharide polymerase [Actinobacillus genomosp. 1]|uniref:ECA oligosaccharide polymerase n=1 Tax=Actinobacillus genomosp. 1 TaxID=254839 RepID=UPI0024433877|nr:ECA oligosaccharide polymerase [Actinobacillus genomosp. 1]WGE33505.1 ECA oligosaccharide polymerase [Actinobacillus genomosp. 1]